MTLKLATSLDGKIATAGGESQWISGPEARALVHRWRADHDAVGVGLGTALADDPRLTARDVEGPVRQPARVVFDSAARLPLRSALVHGAPEERLIILAAADAPPERVAALEAAGAEVARLPGGPARRVEAGLHALGERGIQSLLIEGGAELSGTLVAAGAVDRVAWFLAPMLIGGRDAPVGGRRRRRAHPGPRAAPVRRGDRARGRRHPGDRAACAPSSRRPDGVHGARRGGRQGRRGRARRAAGRGWRSRPPRCWRGCAWATRSRSTGPA